MSNGKGRISDTDLEEVRNRSSIVEVAGQYMKVRQAGRLFKALCPFHTEKTPSFSIDPSKNVYFCLAGETQVLTKDGVRAIRDLAGTTQSILTTNATWVDAPFKSFGVQPLMRVTLTRNRQRKVIHATAEHRWFVHRWDGEKERTTARLRPGEALTSMYPRNRAKLIRELSPFGVAHGITFGDGSRFGSFAVVDLHGEKDSQLLKWFPLSRTYQCRTVTGSPYIKVLDLPLYFKEWPSLGESTTYLAGWLAGYLAADGHVAKDGTVMLNSADRTDLEFVRDVCTRLGIGTFGITTQSRKGLDGSFSDLHRVHFVNADLDERFFLLEEHRRRFATATKKFSRRRWVVESVESTDRVEEVFCAEVPDTHSFTLEDNIITGNCFGCNEGGDVITLVRKLETLDFVEAVEHLARRAGITLHYEQLSHADREKSRTRNRLIDAHREAVDYYHGALLRSAEAKRAREYLTNRSLKQETVETFKIGWSPSAWDSLVKHLRTKGFRDDELTTSGLALRTERGGLIDRFRGRVMFPIFDVTGEPRAFGARKLLDTDDGPKYLNSAESPIYKKGTLLYALNWAKQEIVRFDVAIVVEGYTDVIALHQEGVPLAVASCGTALGAEHFRTLRRFSRTVVIALDADAAGRAATERAVEGAFLDAQGGDMNLRVLTLPEGKDPAEYATFHGGDKFRTLLSDAIPVVEFRLASRLQGLDLSEPEARARALRACLPVLAQVGDDVVLRDYTKWVAERCGLDYDLVFLEVRKTLRGASAPGPAGLKQTSSHLSKEREALKLAVQFPDLVAEFVERLEPSDFSTRVHKTAWEHLRRGMHNPADSDDDAVRELFTRLSVEPIEGVSDGEPGDRLIEEIFTRLEEFALSRQINEVRARLEKMNPLNDRAAYDSVWKQLIELQASKRRLSIDDPAGV